MLPRWPRSMGSWMERRKFLGLFGAAAISGPSIAHAASTEVLKFPGVAPVGLGGWMADDPPSQVGPVTSLPGSHNSWAERAWHSLKRMNSWTRHYRHRAFRLEALDPNTASLRSVALGQKMRISKRIQFQASLELERDRYYAIKKGWLE